MIVATQAFFQLIQVHHRLNPASRPNDLLGRLSMMADPQHAEQMRVTPETQRCLRLFLDRRVQPSSTQASA